MKINSKDVSGVSTLTPTFITEREITGTARVQNNRTMMLASVTTDSQSQGRKGLPILGLTTGSVADSLRRPRTIARWTRHRGDARVLRAPAENAVDEEMRPSGTLQSPTTGSIATTLRLKQRLNDEQTAAARQIPKQVNVAIPVDAPANLRAGPTSARRSGRQGAADHPTMPPRQQTQPGLDCAGKTDRGKIANDAVTDREPRQNAAPHQTHQAGNQRLWTWPVRSRTSCSPRTGVSASSKRAQRRSCPDGSHRRATSADRARPSLRRDVQ